MSDNDQVAAHDFCWRARVYWEDTDAGGVVYHANYLRFLERARTEWLRAQGFDQSHLRMHDGICLVVCSINVDFMQPARLDDELDATVCVDQLRAASMLMTQTLTRVADGVLIARAKVRAACVAADSLKPMALPTHLLKGISNS
ncbi:MAG: tol-pal system-associated acyl-CoA thioesterase [Xanthomonadales bacterium]|nr:tol-pal system-associated acyl-CoA thioesterase [Xanthomonadales bacterium]